MRSAATPGLLQQRQPAAFPLDLLARTLRVQRLRQNLVLHRQHHLHHPQHPRRRLRVPEVRLRRAQPQRTLVTARRPEHRSQGACLDRIPKAGARPVRLDHVDLVRAHPARRQCRPDHTLLARTVGRRQTLAPPVLVHRRATDQRQDLIAITLRVGLPLQHQHPAAFTPPGAVGAIREALAPAIRRNPASGPCHQRRWRRHYVHTARQRQIALALPQRRACQMQRGQR